MTTVNVPGVGPVNFPEGMSERDIIRAIEFDILPSIRPAAPAPVEQERQPTNIFRDVPGAIVSGVGGLGTAAGGLYGLVSGDFDNVATRAGRSIQEFSRDNIMSPGLRQRQDEFQQRLQAVQDQGLGTQALEAVRGLASDPYLFGSMAVEQIPQLAASLGIGRVGGAVGQMAARRAGMEGGEQAARRGATGAAIGAGTGLQTGEVANSTYDDVMRLPAETIERSPAYQELRRTMTDQDAREALATRAAREAAAIAAPLSAASATLLPGVERMAFAQRAQQAALSRILGGAIFEGTQEAIEEGGGRFAQNVGVRNADEDRNLGQGVGSAAATGAALGAGIGGGFAALRGGAPQPEARGEDPELRRALNQYLGSRDRTPAAPGAPDLSEQARLVSETLPVTAEQFMNAAPEVQARLIARAQREAEGRQTGQNLPVLDPQGNRDPETANIRVPQSASSPSDEMISGEAGSRAQSFQFEEGRGEVMDDGMTQAEFFRRRAEEMARQGRPAPTVAADESLLRSARSTQVAPQGTPTEQTIRAAQQTRATQDPLGTFFPLVENFIDNHVRTYGDAEPISVPAFQQYLSERTGDTVSLKQASEIFDTYYNASSQRGIPAGQGWVLQREAVNKKATEGRPSGRDGERMPPTVKFGPGAQSQNLYRAVSPRGPNTDQDGRPLPPAPPAAAPLRAGPSGFTDPRLSALSAREAGATDQPTQAQPTQNTEASERARKVVEDRLAKLEKRLGKGNRDELARVMQDGRFNAEQVYGAFMAADQIAAIMPTGANHKIEFVDRLLIGDRGAAKASGNVDATEAQGERLRPTGTINRARFTQLMREGATADQAFATVQREAVEGIIRLSLAPNQLPLLRETAAHEAFHVLQDYYGKYDPQFARLMNQSFRDGMMITDVDPTIRRKLEQARFPNSNQSYWQALTSTLKNPMDASEAQAYAFGALMDASKRGTPMTGLKPAFARFVNFARQFFTRLGNKLRGDGFQTAEDILGRVAQGDARRFDGQAAPTDQDFPSRGVQASARNLADMPGVDVSEGNKLGFEPALRVRADVDAGTLPRLALITQSTDNKNAGRQLAALDDVLAKFITPENSAEDWAKMEAYAFSSPEVPVPPYNFMRDLNGGAVDLLRTLTPGQIRDADHGFRNARMFRQAYVNKELSPVTTGKLFMWSFLSRGVSPYTQESLFVDAFDGADQWIRKAAQGDFTEADFPAYEQWAKSVAPKGSGQPGAGATHNLNAFGKSFLFKMSRRDAPGGISRLQHLHNLMEDPNSTGQGIRREFVKMASDGVGIDNKVVSFTLLVSGFNDVMVLDRVQMRRLWDDGRFGDKNLYDGETEERIVNGEKKRVTKTGTSLAELTYGARGLLIYEAIERALARRINDIYSAVGRPQDASIGRYHWETWVADSQQEASHGSIDAVLADARGDDMAIARVVAKQGEYGGYEYGARYGRDAQGVPYFIYDAGTGEDMRFSVPAFRGFLTDVKLPESGVVPASVGERPMLDADGRPVLYKVGTKKGQPRTEPIPFSVTESGNAPWYTRPEVNRERLRELASSWADRGGGTGERARAVFADAARAKAAGRDGSRSGSEEGLTDQGASAPKTTDQQIQLSARATNLSVPEFTNWWNGGWRGDGAQPRQSLAVNPDGSPMTFYHGTQQSFRAFGKARSASHDQEGPFFFSPNPAFAEDYAVSAMYAGGGGERATEGQRMLPVYLSIQNVFDSTDPQRAQELLDYVDKAMDNETIDWRDIVSETTRKSYERQITNGELTENRAAGRAFRMFKTFLEADKNNWPAIETRAAQRYIRERGFDSFWVSELGTRNLAVYDPRQIKSIFNSFAEGAARSPQFSARSTFEGSPTFQAALEKVTGKELDNPNVFSAGMRRFVGAKPGEKLSSAFVRTTINRAAPLWMLDRLAKEKGLSLKSAGLAMEVALNNSGRVQMYLEHGPLAYDPQTGDVTIREDVPGLIDAIKGRLDVKDKDKAQLYLVALRERDLRRNGRQGFFNLSDAEVKTIISEAEASRPEWKEMAADIQRINKALLDFAVNTGTLDRSKADQLASMFYTPFYRQAETDAKDEDNAGSVVGPRLSDSLTNVKTAFDVRAKGGVKPLGDLFENMIRNADVIMKAGMKNVAMRQAAETMEAVGLGREAKKRETGKTITYRVNGQDKHFEVDDAVLYTTLAGAPREFANGIYQTMANVAGFFRDMITAAPSFMLANLWRGKIMAYVQEGVPFYTNTFNGLRQALKASSSYKAIAAQTGFGGYTYGMGERDAAKAFEQEIAGLGYGPGGLMRGAFNAFQKASEATEMAERIKLYERMKAQGMTDKEAAYQAYLLAPFSRRGMGGGWVGSSVNWLVPLVPFLNAKIQGMYRLVENEKGDTRVLKSIPKQMFLRGLVVMGASLALAAKNMADEPERWDDETVDLKLRYDILYLPDGRRLLFPRAFEVGTVFGAIPTFLLDAWRKDDGRDLAKVLASFGTSTFFFNPIPQAIQPVIGALANYDFFRDRPLENAGDLSKLPDERVNRNTSTIARLIAGGVNNTLGQMPTGARVEASPIRVQALLEGYSGTIGTSVLAGFDTILAGLGLIPNKPAGAFGDPLSMPAIVAGLTGANRFYRTDDQTASRFVGDFYKIKEQVDQLNRSLTGARERQDTARIAELQGEAGIPLRLRPMVTAASRQLTSVNEQMRRLEQQGLSSEELAARLKPLRERRDQITRRVVERARELGM